MAPPDFPSNVHISQHPCLQAKLSLLRSSSTNARDTKSLVHEISLILGCEAFSTNLGTKKSGIVSSIEDKYPLLFSSPSHPNEMNRPLILHAPQDKTPLNHTYTPTITTPSLTLVPVLRSGLGMLEAFQLLLPQPAPVHHLGLYREPSTLQPVEYYNNLPYHRPSSPNDNAEDAELVPEIAVLLDPVIATGGTAAAAIQTLLEWGVRKVVLVSIIGNAEGVLRAAGQAEEFEGGSEGQGRQVEVEVWVGGVDEGLDERGMIRPGLGDVGDRLFGTVGK